MNQLPHTRSTSVTLNPTLLMLLNESGPRTNTKKRTIDVLQSYRKTVKVTIDKTLPNTIQMARKLPRIKSPNPDIPLVLYGKEEIRLHETLPGYM